jgi:hypothetical protein
VAQATRVAPLTTSASPSPSLRWPAAALSAAGPALVALVFLLGAVRTGLPAASAVREVLAVLATQMLPGVLIWRCVRPRHGWWWEDLAMGFALGTVVAVAAQTAAGAWRLPWLSAAFGLVVAAALVALPASRDRIVTARNSPLPVWWASAVSVCALTAVAQLQSYYRAAPLRWPSGFRALQVDTYFHLALAGELAHRGPARFPWVASEPLAYHWFSHAWIAQVAVVSGTGLDEVLMRFTPALMPLVVSFAVATAALRLTGRPWLGVLAAGLCLAGGDLNVFGKLTPGYPLTPLSPSLALSVPALMGIVVVLALRWRGQLGLGGLVVLPLLTLTAAGSKGSTVPLIVAGLVLAALAMAVTDRQRLRMVLLDLGIVLGCLALAVVGIFRGSDAGLHIDPAAAARQTPAAHWLGVHGTAVVLVIAAISALGVLTRGVGLLGLLTSRESRRDPLTWLLIGAGVAAAGAVALFTHPGDSQWYFARSGGPLLALGSAMGVGVLSDRLGATARRVGWLGVVAGPLLALVPVAVFGDLSPRTGLPRAVVLVAAGLAVLALAAAAAVALRRPGTARPIVVLGTLVSTILAAGVTVVVSSQLRAAPTPDAPSVAATAPLAVSRDQIDAARWIRDHSGVDDIVMTNRHCVTPTPPRGCDTRRYVVAAFTERQVLVEGWTGTPKAAQLAPRGRESIVVNYWQPQLLALNDAFIAHPTAPAARELRALGVRWVYVDHTRPYAASLAPWATLRLHNAGVDVYELTPVR